MLQAKNVRGFGIVDGREAHAFVEARGVGIFCAQTHSAERSCRMIDEGLDQSSADAPLPPAAAHINTADAADGGVIYEGIRA
jgi:hypothetical protein